MPNCNTIGEPLINLFCCLFDSPDYREQWDLDIRVEQLLAMNLSDYDEVILIGSITGSDVATVASTSIKPKGLFCWRLRFIGGIGCPKCMVPTEQ